MIFCIIQARMGSTRLPGKVLKEACGKALLELLVERLKYSKAIDKIIVATSQSEADDEITELCSKDNILFFRGSEDDVLDRFFQAASFFGAKEGDAVIRITGDCPLIDPTVVDSVAELFLGADFDYVSNVLPPTYPDGLDVEILKFSTLKEIWEKAYLASDREHVTCYIENNIDEFSIGNLESEKDYSSIRLTVDEPEDFEIVKNIFEALYDPSRVFLMQEVLDYIEKNKYILQENNCFKRNEGYEKSLQKENKFSVEEQGGKE